MLHHDPKKRLTIKQALEHAWLAEKPVATQEQMNVYFR
jgi:PIN domain nuclease of toxin-antitoxin system